MSLLFAGHVFGIILPSTILALSLAGLYDSVRNSDVSNNKMSFLLLHLGYGGIESSTINTDYFLIKNGIGIVKSS